MPYSAYSLTWSFEAGEFDQFSLSRARSLTQDHSMDECQDEHHQSHEQQQHTEQPRSQEQRFSAEQPPFLEPIRQPLGDITSKVNKLQARQRQS